MEHIAWKGRIKPGYKVIIKPNLVACPTERLSGGVTRWEVCLAIYEAAKAELGPVAAEELVAGDRQPFRHGDGVGVRQRRGLVGRGHPRQQGQMDEDEARTQSAAVRGCAVTGRSHIW